MTLNITQRQRPSQRRQKRGRKGFWSALPLAALLAFAPAGTAKADYYDGGMPTPSFNVQYTGVNQAWQQLFDEARNRWNQTKATANLRIERNDKAQGTMTAAQYPRNWFGLYSPAGQRTSERTFSIYVNTITLKASSGSHFKEWAASTSTHELGHALSLADNPSTDKPSLMKHSRDRTTTLAPQQYDIDEVRRIYP